MRCKTQHQKFLLLAIAKCTRPQKLDVLGDPPFCSQDTQNMVKPYENTEKMQNTLGERRFESQFSFLIFKKHCKYHDLLLTVIRRHLKKGEKHSRGKPSGGKFMHQELPERSGEPSSAASRSFAPHHTCSKQYLLWVVHLHRQKTA